MASSALGGPKTAKRTIQVRRFLTEQQKIRQSHSDPFLPNRDVAETLNPPLSKLSFKAPYVPESDSQPVDGILSSKVNLDEADRFIAALRLPKRQTSVTFIEPRQTIRVLTQVGLVTFRAESDKLDKMRIAESEDPPEDDAEKDAL
jgi:hypothetical protein